MSLVGAGLGFFLADWLVSRETLSGPINLVYLTLLGLLGGYLLSHPLAGRWADVWQRLLGRAKRVPPDAVLAAGVGVTVALVITVLLNSLLEDVPGFTWYMSLIITLLLMSTSGWFFVVNRQLFASRTPGLPLSGSSSPSPLSAKSKVIDTSAIIDGRVSDVIEANFLDGTLLIPRFVLLELQNIADSHEPLRRKRGRRGLEMLDKLVQQHNVKTEVIDEDVPDVPTVDEKLIKLCQKRHADLITTDYNLNRVAALQGVRVLNVNQLAGAIRAMFLPGERLTLHIVREGREPGQGLAYLEDGTMIVVEEASHMVGNTVETVVTSNLQTNMGRMIFARLNGSEDA